MFNLKSLKYELNLSLNKLYRGICERNFFKYELKYCREYLDFFK